MSRSYRKQYVFREHHSNNSWRRSEIRSEIRAAERRILDVHTPEMWEEKDIPKPKECVAAWEWGDYKPYVKHQMMENSWYFPHIPHTRLWNEELNKWTHYRYQRPFNKHIQQEIHKPHTYFNKHGILKSKYFSVYDLT